jgi:hypothetical protein
MKIFAASTMQKRAKDERIRAFFRSVLENRIPVTDPPGARQCARRCIRFSGADFRSGRNQPSLLRLEMSRNATAFAENTDVIGLVASVIVRVSAWPANARVDEPHRRDYFSTISTIYLR